MSRGCTPRHALDGRRLFADVLAQVYSRPSVGLVLGQRRNWVGRLTWCVRGTW